MKKNNFFEFQAPAITPATAEGGAEVFEVNYFDKKAYLSQSPQLYKQIVMSAFERCFSVNKVFRAEPSSTTRHLTEIVSLDAEMAFIESWTDVRDMAEETVRFILNKVNEKHQNELKILGATIPNMIDKTPTLSLAEVQQKIFEKTGRDVRGDKDTNPEDERVICEIIKKKLDLISYLFMDIQLARNLSTFIQIQKILSLTKAWTLFVEVSNGFQEDRRINDYDQLMEHVKIWNMNPDKVKMFLEAFKYGVPPEGGFAFGAEKRITMQTFGT